MSHINFHALNWIDYGILSVLVISMLISFMRGLIKESISLAVWVVALVAAILYADSLGSHLQRIDSENARYVIGFIAIFIGVLLAGMILNVVVGCVLSKSSLRIIDRMLGLFFGVARGILGISAFFMLTSVTGVELHQIKESQLSPSFQPLVKWLTDFVPEKIDTLKSWVPVDHPEDSEGEV